MELDRAESDLCNCRFEEADSLATWFYPDLSKLVVKGQTNGIKMYDHERSNSQS
jgi:hypothetical protein